METLFTIFGIVGAFCCVAIFFVLERGRIEATDPWFYAINGLGSLLVLIGAAYKFDGGDTGSVLQEACWLSISALGFMKHRKKGIA